MYIYNNNNNNNNNNNKIRFCKFSNCPGEGRIRAYRVFHPFIITMYYIYIEYYTTILMVHCYEEVMYYYVILIRYVSNVLYDTSTIYNVPMT